MPSSQLSLANDEPRIDYIMVAQIRQLESVRPDLFSRLLTVFDTNTFSLLEEIPVRINNGEFDFLRVSFHSLKGTAASLGAQRLSCIAGIAEKAIMNNLSVQSLESIVEHLANEFAEARVELQMAAEAKPII